MTAIEDKMLSDPAQMERCRERLASKTSHNPETGCLEWTTKTLAHGGYGKMSVGRAGQIRAHRAAWIFATGKKIPAGLYVCHKCDNPKCCNPDHLFLGTPRQNMADKESKGRGTKPPHSYGEKHHATKLTQAQVEKIHASSETLDRLAAEYGVSSKTIWRIKKGKTWEKLKSIRKPSN